MGSLASDVGLLYAAGHSRADRIGDFSTSFGETTGDCNTMTAFIIEEYDGDDPDNKKLLLFVRYDVVSFFSAGACLRSSAASSQTGAPQLMALPSCPFCGTSMAS